MAIAGDESNADARRSKVQQDAEGQQEQAGRTEALRGRRKLVALSPEKVCDDARNEGTMIVVFDGKPAIHEPREGVPIGEHDKGP